MPKKGSIPKSPLTAIPWPFTREQDLAIFLKTLEEEFGEDGTNTLPAFEALSLIASKIWMSEKPPNNPIPIPWWIVDTLASGFCIYRESAMSTSSVPLGEAYNLQGGGQGKEPRINDRLRHLRDIRIATAIALAKADSVKIEASLQEQADTTGLSVGQIRRIWEKTGSRLTTLSAISVRAKPREVLRVACSYIKLRAN